MVRKDDTDYYLLTDHLGSVVGIADGSGGPISEQRYMPYGLPRLDPGIDETDFGFTGQRNLADIGLMDFSARWYSPSIGAWTRSDAFSGTGDRRWGGYSYGMSNPIRYTDPTGFYADEGCGIGGPHACDISKPNYDPNPGPGDIPFEPAVGTIRLDPLEDMEPSSKGYGFGDSEDCPSDAREAWGVPPRGRGRLFRL